MEDCGFDTALPIEMPDDGRAVSARRSALCSVRRGDEGVNKPVLGPVAPARSHGFGGDADAILPAVRLSATSVTLIVLVLRSCPVSVVAVVGWYGEICRLVLLTS